LGEAFFPHGGQQESKNLLISKRPCLEGWDSNPLSSPSESLLVMMAVGAIILSCEVAF
jgi:hypothetical protein